MATQKNGEYWKQIRQEYIDIINELPLTHIQEQIAKLSEHYITLETQFETATQPTEGEKKKSYWSFFSKNTQTQKTSIKPHHNKQQSDSQKLKKTTKKTTNPNFLHCGRVLKPFLKCRARRPQQMPYGECQTAFIPGERQTAFIPLIS